MELSLLSLGGLTVQHLAAQFLFVHKGYNYNCTSLLIFIEDTNLFGHHIQARQNSDNA